MLGMSASYYDKYTLDPEILKVGMRNIHFRKKILLSVYEITHLYIVRSSLRRKTTDRLRSPKTY